jgi:hypothetical protein
VQSFSEFHDLSAYEIGSNNSMAGGVQINTNPARVQECISMKSDHLG